MQTYICTAKHWYDFYENQENLKKNNIRIDLPALPKSYCLDPMVKNIGLFKTRVRIVYLNNSNSLEYLNSQCNTWLVSVVKDDVLYQDRY